MVLPTTYFEHTGSLDWECQKCRSVGVEPFKITTRGYELPRGDDYDLVLSQAEADHSITCNGRVIFVCAGRNKLVRFDQNASLTVPSQAQYFVQKAFSKPWDLVKSLSNYLFSVMRKIVQRR